MENSLPNAVQSVRYKYRKCRACKIQTLHTSEGNNIIKCSICNATQDRIPIPLKPKPEVISLERLMTLANMLEDYQQRVIFYCLYLTGARISEVLLLRKEDITLADVEGNHFVIFNLRNLKSRKVLFKRLPVIIDNPIVEGMATSIKDYVNLITHDSVIFTLTRHNVTYAYTLLPAVHLRVVDMRSKAIIDDYPFQIHPHYLRHCRLTHLRENKNFDLMNLIAWAGWSDSRPASTYVQVPWQELAKAQIEKKEKEV